MVQCNNCRLRRVWCVYFGGPHGWIDNCDHGGGWTLCCIRWWYAFHLHVPDPMSELTTLCLLMSELTARITPEFAWLMPPNNRCASICYCAGKHSSPRWGLTDLCMAQGTFMMELGLILMIDLGFPLSTSVAGEYLQFCICYMGCPFFWFWVNPLLLWKFCVHFSISLSCLIDWLWWFILPVWWEVCNRHGIGL